MRDKLRRDFEDKTWVGPRGVQPRSGPGSNMKNTARLRGALPDVFKRYAVKRFVDAPCGDWFWMQHVNLDGIKYIGGDIATSIVDENIKVFPKKGVSFVHLDVTSDPLPECDILMCRECLFHLKYWLRWEFFKNFVQADIPYLMTTIDHIPGNKNIPANGGYSPFDPRLAPFNFPEPLEMIHETVDKLPTGDDLFISGRNNHRSMGIWSKEQIIKALERRGEDVKAIA